MFTLAFWKATAERAIKTLAQTAASFIVIGVTGLIEIEWLAVASISGAAALASVLTSLASAAATDGGPSLGGENIERV